MKAEAMPRRHSRDAQAVLDRLYGRRRFGIKFGLHVEEALLARLGRPERSYAVVHVAGTNGKGSVCAIAASVLRAAGLRVGLYTSPHLVRLNERVVVDGDPIDDDALVRLVEEMERHAEAVAAELGQEPTFFELVTALGFEFFRRKRVQVAVVEVGMGGRLDATNVVTPLVAVVTGIGLEHTQYLGPDIESIAREKCGIIKRGRPVVCGALPEEALAVVRGVCRERGAPLRVAPESVSVRVVSEDLTGQTVQLGSDGADYGKVRLPLAGRHQAGNLATAVAAVETAADALGIPVAVETVRAGIEATAWPGRLQVIGENPLVIVDGAHNPPAAEALAAALERLLQRRPLALVVGMCGDKDAAGFLRPLARIAKRLWVAPIPSERNMEPARIISAARAAGLEAAQADLAGALAAARQWAREARGAVCVTGSLFLAGAVSSGGGEADPN